MNVKVVEMRRFNGIQLLQQGENNSSKFAIVYDRNIFKPQVERLLKAKGTCIYVEKSESLRELAKLSYV